MSRILLVDDSPHALRMGERILSEEGYEVVAVSNADSALIRLEDVDPDIVLADTVMPGRTGYEICQYLKMSPRHRHVRVVLTAGVVESFDEERSKRVAADGSVRKPFEASALLAVVKPLAEAAAASRAETSGQPQAPGARPATFAAPFVAVVDSEQVRAAVTVALDAAMGTLVDEIASRVVAALKKKAPEPEARERAPEPPAAPVPPQPEPARPVAAAESGAAPVRRVTPLRHRAGSILGLDLIPAAREEPESPAPGPKSPAP